MFGFVLLAVVLGLNLRHAVNGYGILTNSLNVEVLAQSNSTGNGSSSGGGSSTGGGSSSTGGNSSNGGNSSGGSSSSGGGSSNGGGSNSGGNSSSQNKFCKQIEGAPFSDPLNGLRCNPKDLYSTYSVSYQDFSCVSSSNQNQSGGCKEGTLCWGNTCNTYLGTAQNPSGGLVARDKCE